MGALFGIAWIVPGLIVPAALLLAQRWLLRRGPGRAAAVPAVSVLRPVCGADPALEANLESLFRQDHPEFEVLVAAADADDPALDVARRVAARHPHVPSQVIADARRIGINRKVNNLANLARLASHGVFVVSDSNVALPQGCLRSVAARLASGARLVSSPIAARPAGTLGSALESLQLNTFVMGGVGLVTRTGGVCCVGKSMAFRRDDLDAIGGFAFLGRHLAEDQVCGETFARAGLAVTVDGLPVENVIGPLTLRDFVARHLRWARIRRFVAPAAYAAELLSNPVAAALAVTFSLPPPLGAACGTALLLLRAASDAAQERRLGVRRPWWSRVPLLVLKESLLLALWPMPFLGREVEWRGNRYRLGAKTRLEPVPAATPAGPAISQPWPVLPDFAPDLEGDPVAATA